MPPIKIFVDSALRRSGTDSNFAYELPRPVAVDKAYKALIDQVHIPHTFTTIHAQNKAIYFQEQDNTHTRQHRIELTPAQYDGPALATHLAAILNAASTVLGTWTITFDAAQGKLQFSVASGLAKLYAMDFLQSNPGVFSDFHGHAVGHHDDAGPIIGITGQFVLTISSTPVFGKHISVSPYHTLYLHCDQGLGTGGDDVIGTHGNATVLRSIPVTSQYGQMLHDMSLNPHDYSMVPKGQLGTFKFRLADRFNRDISLDQGFSFSMVFLPVDEFE